MVSMRHDTTTVPEAGPHRRAARPGEGIDGAPARAASAPKMAIFRMEPF